MPETLRGAFGSSPVSFQLTPWPPAYQKIMEDSGLVETSGDDRPPDLPLSPKLPLKSGLQPDRCLDGQAAVALVTAIFGWAARLRRVPPNPVVLAAALPRGSPRF